VGAGVVRLANEEGDALVKAVHGLPNGSAHDQALLQYIYGVLSQRGGEAFRGDASAALERCAEEARKQVLVQARFS
jgi:hypothetical protein